MPPTNKTERDERCETCFFWGNRLTRSLSRPDECHRFPPGWKVGALHSGKPASSMAWVQTTADEWCGEWKDHDET